MRFELGCSPGHSRFDAPRMAHIEHLFRLMKPTLGWTRPKLRSPEAGERWTWLIIAAHTQIRFLREAAAGLRRPREKPAELGRLTPARVRRGVQEPPPAPALPGPRTETLNTRTWNAPWLEEPAARPCYDVGKTAKRPESIVERNRLRA